MWEALHSYCGSEAAQKEAYRQKVPVWPVVSTPAKNSAAISGNILRSLRRLPVLGSLARSSRSAKLPRCGCVRLDVAQQPAHDVLQHSSRVSF